MSATKISFVRGDTAVYSGAALTDGAPASLVGCTLFFTVKPSFSANDAEKVFQKTVGSGISVTNAAGGLFSVNISPADTRGMGAGKIYVWEVRIKQPDGTISTPEGLAGTFIVTPEVLLTVP